VLLSVTGTERLEKKTEMPSPWGWSGRYGCGGDGKTQ